MNEKWVEVIELAEKYGLVLYCYGGVAILASPEEQERRRKLAEKEIGASERDAKYC